MYNKCKLFIVIFFIANIALSEEFKRSYDDDVNLEKIEKKLRKIKKKTRILNRNIINGADERKTKLDFDNHDLNGSAKSPTGFLVTGNKNHTLNNMIELRENFEKELEDSIYRTPKSVFK